MISIWRNGMMGLIIGDALGVTVQFLRAFMFFNLSTLISHTRKTFSWNITFIHFVVIYHV